MGLSENQSGDKTPVTQDVKVVFGYKAWLLFFLILGTVNSSGNGPQQEIWDLQQQVSNLRIEVQKLEAEIDKLRESITEDRSNDE